MDLSIFFLATLLEYKLHVFKPCNSITCIPMYTPLGVSLVAQTVKSLPAMQDTWVQSLDQEDPLEEGMAIHSSILAWTAS